MSWNMIGLPISTAEMSGVSVTQKITSGSKRKLIKGVQAGVILYNDPAFTDLAMRVYTDNAGSPGTLIATSTAIAKASILTAQDHAYKVIGFSFANAFPMPISTVYHFALYATGYTGDASSHIAWRFSYPDPQYQGGLTLDAAHADNHPLEITLVGADL